MIKSSPHAAANRQPIGVPWPRTRDAIRHVRAHLQHAMSRRSGDGL